MNYALSFKELETYKLAREISFEIFKFSKSFPSEEKYSLTDQIRRSSRSVGAQIAEGWGKRRYEKHFISKLTDADGEQLETQHWLEVAFECDYIKEEQFRHLTNKCELLGRMIQNMINKSSKFCKT
ncbi:four helix bundle protein [Gaoshiqia sp. Z1-71]|uniref:four helix bundle protein n=1 Tax=Gaoshiqia hydrogeniformans TaxID=3290090 RepID=UPI003BF7C6E4